MYVCKGLPRIALSADKHRVPSHQEQAPQCAKSQEVPVRSPSHRDAGFVMRMLFFSHVSHAYTSIMYLYIYKFHEIYIYIYINSIIYKFQVSKCSIYLDKLGYQLSYFSFAAYRSGSRRPTKGMA